MNKKSICLPGELSSVGGRQNWITIYYVRQSYILEEKQIRVKSFEMRWAVTWSRNPKEVSKCKDSGKEHSQQSAKTKRPEVGRNIGFLRNSRKARMVEWSEQGML